MKKTIKNILFVVLLLLQVNSLAQMQSLPLNPSSERIIPNLQSIIPKKSLAINSGEILSLNLYSNSGNTSLFCKTKDGDTIVKATTFLQAQQSIDTIHDFDYNVNDSMIYYCGEYNNQGCVGFEYTYKLFSTNSNQVIRIDLNGEKAISKIHYYVGAAGKEKLALISDGNKFIDFDLSSFTYDVYESPYQLLDIAITDNKVCVLGYVNNKEFILYSHDKNSISNFQDLTFITPAINTYFDTVGFHITELNGDDIMVGFSLGDNYDEFCTIDLSSLSIMGDQAIPQNIGKTRIIDLEYCPTSNKVLCLNNMIGLSNIIYTVDPYANTIYTTTAVLPNNNILYGQEQRLYSVANYDNNYYLVLGRDSLGRIYFFDKEIGNFTNNSCYNSLQFDIDMANDVFPNTSIGYINTYNSSSTVTYVPFTFIQASYNIICQ